MEFGFTKEQDEFRRRVESFFERELTPKLRAEVERNGSGWSPDLYMRMIKGGIGRLLIPPEYGGEHTCPMSMGVLHEVMARAEVPRNVIAIFNSTLHHTSIVIMRSGTEEQKQRWLPELFEGRLRCTQGLTEPGCGSDLASVQMRAVEDGDEYVLTGQKIFNNGRLCTHIILATRTDPNVPKHKGITLFMTRIQDVPGVTITPMVTTSGWERNIVSFDEVRVSKRDMIGGKNEGWYVLMRQMDLERSGININVEWVNAFEQFVSWVKAQTRDGKPLAQHAAVRERLADLRRELFIGWLLCYQIMDLQETKQDATLRASFGKLYNSEIGEHLANLAIDIAGRNGIAEKTGELGAKYSPHKGLLSRLYKDSRIHQIAGGTSEIQRNIIAQRGLGLPR